MDETKPPAPSLEYLMASVIRLMAACVEHPCPAEQRTLLHLLNYLLKHPSLARTPGVEGAVQRAVDVWRRRTGAADAAAGDTLH